MSKTFKAACIVCCLCLLVCGLTTPAQAASILTGNYDPADYITSVTADGTTKIVTYDFSDIQALLRSWDNYSNSAKMVYDSLHMQVPVGATQAVINCFPLGRYAAVNDTASYGGLIVNDILPGSPLDFSMTFRYVIEAYEHNEPVEIAVNYSYGCFYYAEDGSYLGVVEKVTDPDVISVSGTVEKVLEGTIPANAYSIIPWCKMSAKFSSDQAFDFWAYGVHFMLSANIDTVIENSNQMAAIKDKLDDLNVSIGGVDDKLDQILQQPDQEKSDATQGANDAFQNVIQAVPDHSEGLVDAFSGLAASMSYNGTVAKLDIPQISMPGLDGLFDGFIIMQPQELNFEVYFQMLPENLLLLVQSLFTGALIIFCFKELYGTIQYCMTLRG